MTSDAVVLFHYFKDANADKCTADSAIRSCIDQLWNYYKDMKDSLLSQLESSLNEASLRHSHHADYPELWDLFSASILQFIQSRDPTKPCSITLVLDALDECKSPLTLVKNLLNLAVQSGSKFRVLVTGRHSAWDDIERSIPARCVRPVDLVITPEDVQQDIAKVVRDTISSIARLSSDKFKDLRDRLSEEISKVENHQGMFLWAFFMCEEVKGQGNVRALCRLLNHLPKGLDALYSRICKAIIERDESLGLSVSVLKWVMNAPRPLRFHELEEGLRLMQKDTSTEHDWFYASSDILWSREDIVEACGNIVVYSGMEKGDTFAPVHLCATEFFRRKGKTSEKIDGDTHVFIDSIRDAEPTLGTMCLEYLLSQACQSEKYLAPSKT
ncbi:hypothetical protein H0H87_004714, partial [Tephrocybe sp. NHM501043]